MGNPQWEDWTSKIKDWNDTHTHTHTHTHTKDVTELLPRLQAR